MTFVCFFLIQGCHKKQIPVDIKILILKSEEYLDRNIVIDVMLRQIGLEGVWYIVEDKSGFIQITTENIYSDLSCIKPNKNLRIMGKLRFYEHKHMYFSVSKIIGCDI